jgi:hypothetical protein
MDIDPRIVEESAPFRSRTGMFHYPGTEIAAFHQAGLAVRDFNFNGYFHGITFLKFLLGTTTSPLSVSTSTFFLDHTSTRQGWSRQMGSTGLAEE